MSVLSYVIIITGVAGIAGTGAGGLFGVIFRKNTEKTAALLLNTAAGAMLSIVCLDLIPEALEISGLTLAALGISLGFSAVYLLNDLTALLPGNKADISLNSSRKALLSGGIITAAAIALHNFPEGMVIGASLAGADSAELLTHSRLAAAVVIGLHNIPEGMAAALPLVLGGMKKASAVFITALAGAPTVAGALIGYTLGSISPIWLSLSLSLASGAMLYVVFGELLPEALSLDHAKLQTFAVIAGILIGLIIIKA